MRVHLMCHAMLSMHACSKVCVKWGIEYLKRQFARWMKRFDATKSKYTHLFMSCALLTNILHERRMNLFQQIFGNRVNDLETHMWEEDY